MTTDFWNSRYGEPGFAYGTTPNAFLASQQARLRPGGLLVMEAFTPRQLSGQYPSGGPMDPDRLFTAAMADRPQ